MYQTATKLAPVPNVNGVGNCSSGNNQSSPVAGCDYLLTNGMAIYRTLENLLNNGFTASYDSTRVDAKMFPDLPSRSLAAGNRIARCPRFITLHHDRSRDSNRPCFRSIHVLSREVD